MVTGIHTCMRRALSDNAGCWRGVGRIRCDWSYRLETSGANGLSVVGVRVKVTEYELIVRLGTNGQPHRSVANGSTGLV